MLKVKKISATKSLKSSLITWLIAGSLNLKKSLNITTLGVFSKTCSIEWGMSSIMFMTGISLAKITRFSDFDTFLRHLTFIREGRGIFNFVNQSYDLGIFSSNVYPQGHASSPGPERRPIIF